MLKNHILRELYIAITSIPEKLEDSFLEGLISTVLPLLESQISNEDIEDEINQLYRSNRESRDNIKNIVGMRGFSISFENLNVRFPNFERLVTLLKERIEGND